MSNNKYKLPIYYDTLKILDEKSIKKVNSIKKNTTRQIEVKNFQSKKYFTSKYYKPISKIM